MTGVGLRTQIWMTLVLSVASGAPAHAQHERLTPDETGAAAAAVEWVAQQMVTNTYDANLVVSRLTNGAELRRDETGVRIYPAPKRTIPFHAELLDQIESRTGIRAVFCDELDAERSLCGVSRPWLWVLLSAPTRDGASLLFELEEREMPLPPPGYSGMGSGETVSTFLQLRRDDKRWHVIRLEQ